MKQSTEEAHKLQETAKQNVILAVKEHLRITGDEIIKAQLQLKELMDLRDGYQRYLIDIYERGIAAIKDAIKESKDSEMREEE